MGLKESEGNLPFTLSILARFPGFQVFVGNELQIVEAVRHGGMGSICGIANLYPELIRALYEQPEDSHVEKIKALFQALEKIPFIPAAKSVMERRRGSVWQTICPPLVPLSAMESQEFLSCLTV